MQVDIADLKLEAGRHKTVPVQVAVDSVEMGGQIFHFPDPFTGEAEIWNAGDRLLVQAKLRGEVVAECSRCLSPFRLPLKVAFDEEFVEGNPEDERVAEEGDEDRTLSYYQGDAIDLSDSLRENVLLELPMKPLCSEECKGLCPTCGTNLNEGPCKCTHTEAVDPRFLELQKLLKRPDHN
ncbi:MAG: YceD family protein [Mycobacterium leprae]